MAFDNVRLPEDIERGAQGGPAFQTTIVALGTGREQRNVDWFAQRCSYDVSYGVQKKSDFIAVVKFFYARLGRARGFRFKDWTDYEAVNEQIGIGDGSTILFQLVKNYNSLVTYQRKITRPVAGTTSIRVNGVITPFSINVDTGVVTINPAPAIAAVITASFEFDVPVRFDSDKLDLNARTWEVASIPSIEIVELPE